MQGLTIDRGKGVETLKDELGDLLGRQVGRQIEGSAVYPITLSYPLPFLWQKAS